MKKKSVKSLSRVEIADLSNYFSQLEIDIIMHINSEPTTIIDLAEAVYGSEMFNANNNAAARVRHIINKCQHYKLGWIIGKEGLGRGGTNVWIEKRVN